MILNIFAKNFERCSIYKYGTISYSNTTALNKLNFLPFLKMDRITGIVESSKYPENKLLNMYGDGI